MAWMILPLAVAVLSYCLIVIPRSSAFTAETVFVYLQFIMAAGSLTLLNPDLASDRVYATIIAYTLVAFMVTSGLLTLIRYNRPQHPLMHLKSTTYVPGRAFWILLVVAIAITAAYYAAVGYSAFFRGLVDGFTGADSDIAGLRLDSYSGSRYLFPGYVNQFKNALLPSLTVLAITYWAAYKKRRSIATVALCIIATLGLIGTGQRGAFVLFMGVVTIYLVTINRGTIPRRYLALGGAAFLVIIIVTTFALGRAALQANASIFDHAGASLDQFVLRIFTANQSSGVIGFRYIYHLGPLYDGSEWAQSLAGILPGERGSDLQNRIFEIRYGSDRGTSPPSIWGSVYYNFGPVGVALAPVVVAIIYRRLVVAALDSRTRNGMELIGVAGTFLVLGFWVSGSPLFLLNRGLAVYLFLWWWGQRIRARTSSLHGTTATASTRLVPARRAGF